ncbi:MAG: GspE/PulE family protein [Candidatus Pacebacteria bacterium]|nr:GspE/PulE family protein [Candidatus Paceibacterota bacterium]
MDFKSDPKEEERLSFVQKHNLDSQENDAKSLAQELDLPYIYLLKTQIQTDALKEVSKETAQKLKLICFNKRGSILDIAIVNLSKEVKELKQELEKKDFEINLYVCSLVSFDYALEKYSLVPKDREVITGEINISDSKYIPFNDLNEFDLSNLTTNFVLNIILKSAIYSNVSDIHINPQKESCQIKFRIDGLLYNVLELNKEEYTQIKNRIKLLANLKINILNTPQDGRFTILDKENYEVRLSSIPGNNGEILVMRILDPSKITLKLNDLGINDYELKLINLILKSTNGGVLVTGPTGSGKTTTLYAMLKEKLNKGLNITTIEDPIEYKIKEINQTQVNEKQGYDFANGLRSIVRQDPDIILVGEIRDRETAQIASQASLTGHLLLSTLHTNEAAATIMRLKEFGIDHDTISSFLRIIIAQRLCRKLCPHCMEKYVPSQEVKNQLKNILSILSYKTGINIPDDIKYLYRSKGCEKCNNLDTRDKQVFLKFYFSTISSKML